MTLPIINQELIKHYPAGSHIAPLNWEPNETEIEELHKAGYYKLDFSYGDCVLSEETKIAMRNISKDTSGKFNSRSCVISILLVSIMIAVTAIAIMALISKIPSF